MSRLPQLDLDALDDAQTRLLDALESGPRGARHGRLGQMGPFGVWLHAPNVGHAAQALGAAVRFETSLPETLKEIAICTVGAHYKAKFEFGAHGPMAVAAGVDEAVVEAIRTGNSPKFTDADEQLVYELTRSLVRDHQLDPAQYARAQARLGNGALVELVTLIGYYCLISLTLNAFDVPLAPNMTDPFPA